MNISDVESVLTILSVFAVGMGLWFKLNGMQKDIQGRQDSIASGIYSRIGSLDAKLQAHELKVAEHMVIRKELPDIIRATAHAVRIIEAAR